MENDLAEVIDQIRYCLESADISNVQFLIPAFKLLQSCYMREPSLTVTDDSLSVFSDTIQYIIQTSDDSSCDKRLLAECSLVVAQSFYSLLKANVLSKVLEKDETRNKMTVFLVNLLNNQRDDGAICTTLLITIEDMHSDILHLPEPVLKTLCEVCSYILSQPDQYNTDVLSLTMSFIPDLLQISDLMQWFIDKGLILKLSFIFNNRECSVMMCRFFVVIINQIAANEKYHNELINSISFTTIINCIQSFVQDASTDPDSYHIVELCFVYLLRIFFQDTAKRIADHREAVTSLLHFLYEAIFQSCYIRSSAIASSSATSSLFTSTLSGEPASVALQVHLDETVLMNYVMSLFSLLCYNSERPEIIQPATIHQICTRINSIPNVNVVLFLHQFLSFALASDPSLFECITTEENLRALITNLHTFPTESLLTVFSHILHADVSPEQRAALRVSLNHLAFPSILISIITHSDSTDDSSRLSIDPSLDAPTADSPRVTVRSVTRTLYLFSLDLLRCFFTDGYCLVLDDASLITGLLSTMSLFLTDRSEEGGKIVVIAASILLSVGAQYDNFCLIENEANFITAVSDLLFRAKNRHSLTLLLFAILSLYAQKGNLQKLVGDRRFSEVLRFTYRTLSQNASELHAKSEIDPYLDEPLDEVLNLALGFSRLFHVVANRLGDLPPAMLPVMGEVFQFVEAVLSSVVCEEVVNSTLETCTSLWNQNIPTIRDRLKEITKAVLPGTLSKGGLAESSITRINTAMGLFV